MAGTIGALATSHTPTIGFALDAGFNNPAWDHEFLDLLETNPKKLAQMPHADYARLGGFEGAEVISLGGKG